MFYWCHLAWIRSYTRNLVKATPLTTQLRCRKIFYQIFVSDVDRRPLDQVGHHLPSLRRRRRQLPAVGDVVADLEAAVVDDFISVAQLDVVFATGNVDVDRQLDVVVLLLLQRRV